MNKCFYTRAGLAEYVTDLLKTLEPNSALTITIGRAKYGEYYVPSATEESLEGTSIPDFLKQQRNISDKAPDYTFPPSPPRSEEEIVADLRKGFEKSSQLNRNRAKEKDAGLE